MRYFIAGTALMLAASPVAAQGFNPFGSLHTTTGAYMTTPGGSVTVRTLPERSAAMSRETRANMQGDPAERSSFPSLTSPPTLYSPDGGPQPAISGSTPPLVSFRSSFGAGNIVIDSGGRSLYYVVSSTQAYRYPVAVGREGFSWTGVEKVSRKAQWPDWRPPAEMRERQPGLPEVMSGGLRNPLGARAIYLGSSLYRIHGTNDSRSIGSASSSGCFRMTNAYVVDLFNRVSTGATVHVVPRLPASIARGIAQVDDEETTVVVARRRS